MRNKSNAKIPAYGRWIPFMTVVEHRARRNLRRKLIEFLTKNIGPENLMIGNLSLISEDGQPVTMFFEIHDYEETGRSRAFGLSVSGFGLPESAVLAVGNEVVKALRISNARLERRDSIATGRANRQALALIEWTSALLPRKVNDEQIGDLVELLTELEKANAHRVRIQLQALAGVFWAFLYTLRDFVKSGAILTAFWKFLN